MSKRLQVLLDPKEYKQFMTIAKTQGMSLGEWVRQALRATVRQRSVGDAEEKLARIKRLAEKGDLPTGDIESLLAEIERGRL